MVSQALSSKDLDTNWNCLFANDIDPEKARAFRTNNDGEVFHLADINTLTTNNLPGHADLAWASFPCQDLSLAGPGIGLQGKRSGTFWAFWRLMEALNDEKRTPAIITLENVPGLITSNQGRDFSAIVTAMASLDYRIMPVIIDAAQFAPQSRPRLFMIGIAKRYNSVLNFISTDATLPWAPKNLVAAINNLPSNIQANIVWFNAIQPAKCNTTLGDVIDDQDGMRWHDDTKTKKLLHMMDERNFLKVKAAQRTNRKHVGALYKRTRLNNLGKKIQRAEVRFDGLAGCLRTPGGGSSRQTLFFVEESKLRSRLITPREAARLMGLSDDYQLPASATAAYRILGDGVCVPVVKFLAEEIFRPILASKWQKAA